MNQALVGSDLGDKNCNPMGLSSSRGPRGREECSEDCW